MPLSPPRPPQPPLNALRAFESAARLGGFLQAAEELGVTPGAIAQQIKKLELWAGAPLFERLPQGVRLTALGASVLPELGQGLDLLGQAGQALRQGAGHHPVRIAALPAVAQLWLSPRLSALGQALPGVALSVDALETCPALARGAFDLAVFPLTRAAAARPGVTILAEERLVPVAAPSLAREIARPEDLAGQVLLHDGAWRDDWPNWAAAAGIARTGIAEGPSHSLYSIAVARCAAGEGVLMGHMTLLAEVLREGRLVALFPELALDGDPICLVAPDRPPGPVLARVIQAMIANARGEPDQIQPV